MYLHKERPNTLFMNVQLEVYPDDELGKDGDEKDGRKSSMGAVWKLAALVRVAQNVPAECEQKSGSLEAR
jgi:hypothetical protein